MSDTEELSPQYDPRATEPAIYEGWTFQNLSAALADYNIEPIKSGGVKVIRATDVIHALTYYDRHGNTQRDG